jgi:hypothetical protein
MFNREKAKLLPNADTDIFICAYPRSGNDYAKQLTKKYNQALRICSHFHKPGALKIALNLNIPVIGILREPFECISSSMVKYKKESNLAEFPIYPLYDYIIFHRNMLKFINKIDVIKFDDLIKNPRIYFDKLKFNLNINSNNNINLENLTFQINKKLNNEALHCNQIIELKKGPDPLKEKIKSDAKQIISKHTIMLKEANALYQNLLRYA